MPSLALAIHTCASSSALHSVTASLPRPASASSLLAPQHQNKQRSKSSLGSAPRSAEELLQPLTREGALPEWASQYVSLLAESTTCNGSMQKHLIKMLARGAGAANKVAQFVHDPLNPVTGHLANTGSEAILKQLASKVSKNDDGSQPKGWSMVRNAVLGKTQAHQEDGQACPAAECGMPTPTSCSKDDTCMPDPEVNQSTRQLLSLMLSMLMSGAISGVSAELPAMATSPFALPFNAGPSVEVSISNPGHSTAQQQEQFSSAIQRAASLQRAGSLARAPSLLTHTSLTSNITRAPSIGVEGIFGAGSMATSTAMKLLRADSKRFVIPDLGNVLDSVLDSVNESMDDGDEPRHKVSLQQQACPQQQQQQQEDEARAPQAHAA